MNVSNEIFDLDALYMKFGKEVNEDQELSNVIEYFKAHEFEKESAISFKGNKAMTRLLSEKDYKKMRLNDSKHTSPEDNGNQKTKFGGLDNPQSLSTVPMKSESSSVVLNESERSSSPAPGSYALLDSMYPQVPRSYERNDGVKTLFDLNQSSHSHSSVSVSAETNDLNSVEGSCFLTSEKYVISPENPWYGPYRNERRIDYLQRFHKLTQVGLNTGNVRFLNYLLKESLTEDCIMESEGMPAVIGRDKIANFHAMILANFPDFYCVTYSLKKINRRTYCFKRNCIFTYLPNTSTHELEQLLEGFNIGSSDENTKILMEKYYRLKSQNKAMRFERSSNVFLGLNSDCVRIEKIVHTSLTFEIFEVDSM